MNMMNLENIEEKKSNIDLEFKNTEKKYVYIQDVQIKYEILNPLMKNLQMFIQLVKLIKHYEYNDLIFIFGNSTCSVNSRFYFNYRKIIDLYFLVLYFEENENSLEIKYNIYKSKPNLINFIIDFSLIKNEDNCKIKIELIPQKGIIIPENLLNIIFDEINYNFLYLSLALKLKRQNSIYFNSGIIKNEFFVLSQIFQNIKLIEYLINGKLIKVENKNSAVENGDKYIHLNDTYKINFSKNKDETILNDTSLKIIDFKSREEKLIINLKVLFNKSANDNKDSDLNYIYNHIYISLIKVTKNTTFILIKCIFDANNTEIYGKIINKTLKKIFNKIEKLSDITKNNVSF